MSDTIKVEFIYLPVINFAMQQNRVSVVRKLAIENLTDDTLNDVKIVLSVEPAFGAVTPVFIESIPGKETVCVNSVMMDLSAGYFAQLTERYSGHIAVEVFVKSESVFMQNYPVDILAYDQWSGISVLPEMLSAYIIPNHPSIAPILKRAAEILEKWTGSPSLDEYQSRNPDRVRKQMAAIYTALSEHKIIYSTIPASFEEYGQRVRLPDVVLSQKLGTCLDMALLYASCLEAAGIHAIIIVITGHAFAGGWLVPETFPDSVIDDVSLLTKRTADGINDIVLAETTCMNSGNNSDFDYAVHVANEKLTRSEFIMAIDVRRSRFSGIRPLPQRVLNGQQWDIKDDENARDDKSSLAPRNINPYDLSGISAEIEVTKQLLWERKLLDLSLRNNLLNIRITKNTLQLISTNLSLFEDALADGEEFRILHKPTDWDNPLCEFGVYHKVTETDPVFDLIKSELTQKRLRSYLTELELGKALTHLYRSSRTAMEENGANTLYLSLGLLKWYETPASERPRYAPILLVPVEIIRKSAAKGYVIRTREEETMMNITLLEMLRQNFNINITGLSVLPTDESGVNVNLIYSVIRNSIKNQPKWDVEEQAVLGIFSFSKFIMWNDIHNNSRKLAKNEIVSSLMSGRIEWNAEAEMADASDLDKRLSPTDIMLPISADSSQLEAIFEAANDTSFILHGPPGTGKSQTITNIIANALYRGKRVLFVAEKMAALTVVQKRLNAIGLAPFCLEIHSNKIKKSSILSQLKTTSEVVRCNSPENFGQEAERVRKLRIELNKYVEALHHVYPFGLSLYEAIVRYELLNETNNRSRTTTTYTGDIPETKEFTIPQSYISELDKDTILQWQEALEAIVSTAKACGHPYNHPLTGITIPAYSPDLKDDAFRNISDTVAILSDIKARLVPLNVLFGADTLSCRGDIDILSKITERLLNTPELTSVLLTSPRLNEKLDEYKDVCVHGKERDKIKQSLVSGFSDGVLVIDAKKTLFEWNQASVKWFLPRYFGQKKVVKLLSGYALNGVDKGDIINILSGIIKYQEEKIFVNENAGDFPAMFGKSGRKGNENWEVIERIIEDLFVINNLISELTNDIAGAVLFKERLAYYLSDGIRPFKNLYGSSLTELNSLIAALNSKEQILFETLGLSKQLIYYSAIDEWIEPALSKLNTQKNNLEKLKDWYQWLLVYNRMNALKIGFVALEFKDKNIEASKIVDVFNRSLYKAIITFIISKSPDLELFKGVIFSDIIEKYRRLASEFEKLARKELFARLASNLPSFTREAIQSSEVGILQRNIRNNARGISIRKLFDQIPKLLSRMSPCMLMSPISVAQYIDPDAEKFDLIVFDEA